MDEKTLREMIKEQKQIVDRAQSQLSKLYNMAQELGFAIDRSEGAVYNPQGSAKDYIDEQRRQIMQKVDSLRAQAMTQAQKALDSTKSMQTKLNIPQMPNIMGSAAIPQMPKMPNMASEPDLAEIKEKFEEALKAHKGELPQEAIDAMRKKLDGDKEDE
jgi:hypothetical protein